PPEGPADDKDGADQMRPISIRLGRTDVLPRQGVKTSNIPLHFSTIRVEVVIIAFALIVINGEKDDNEDKHQGNEDDDDSPEESDEEIAI
ncbi:MAG: hypothetical protein Q9183_004026, partial [Haloplaca sp. 2 TL-2023]